MRATTKAKVVQIGNRLHSHESCAPSICFAEPGASRKGSGKQAMSACTLMTACRKRLKPSRTIIRKLGQSAAMWRKFSPPQYAKRLASQRENLTYWSGDPQCQGFRSTHQNGS